MLQQLNGNNACKIRIKNSLERQTLTDSNTRCELKFIRTSTDQRVVVFEAEEYFNRDIYLVICE